MIKFSNKCHCVTSVSVFGIILDRIFPYLEWIRVSPRIQSNCGKIRTSITPNTTSITPNTNTFLRSVPWFNQMYLLCPWLLKWTHFSRNTEQKIKFSIKDFLSKCNHICSFLRPHLLKKYLMTNSIFCVVKLVSDNLGIVLKCLNE